jgi:UrcA family protein
MHQEETAMYRFATPIMIFALGFGYQLANAAPCQDVPSANVHFADLDLTHGEGVAVLYRRLKGAAETVCAPQNGRDLGSEARYKVCWQSALGAAVAKVDQSALTIYYRAQFNRPNATVQIAQN